MLSHVGDRRLSGITQVSADRDVTYANAARRLCHLLGADPSLIQPVMAEAQTFPGALPLNTTLDTIRLRECGLNLPADWAGVDSVLAS